MRIIDTIYIISVQVINFVILTINSVVQFSIGKSNEVNRRVGWLLTGTTKNALRCYIGYGSLFRSISQNISIISIYH